MRSELRKASSASSTRRPASWICSTSGSRVAQRRSRGSGTPRSRGPGSIAGWWSGIVTDATTGDAVPYLPVSASVEIPGAPARVVKLTPMIGDDGFHYGANTTLPGTTRRIVVTIGAATVPVMGADRTRYMRPRTASFDWSAPAK